MLFFFSSRRRHTRLVSDWSSDVCSSDLRIDNNVLDQLEECRTFRTAKLHASTAKDEEQPSVPALEAATPEERVEGAAKEIEEDLQAELLERVVKASPAFFEKLVVELLVAMNYGGAGA